MSRRVALVVALGGAAAALGAGVAVWRGRAGGEPDIGAAQALWSLRLPRPGGGELALQDLRGRPLVLNFWATWCAPCVKEMPELDRFARDFAPRGWQVLGLAIDNDAPVRDFLQRVPVSFPIVLGGAEGTTLAQRFGNAQGGLPYTVLIDARGRVVRRKAGATHYAELAGWAGGA